MLFSLPENSISEIIGYSFNFFTSMKVYIFLACGVGLAMIIINIFHELLFGFRAGVKREARRRLEEEAEEELEEEFEEAVEEEIERIIMEE